MFSYLRPHGMGRFYVLWAGSLVSLFGSTMTAFLLGILAYEKNHSSTAFAFVLVSYTLPALVIAPFAGVLVDRWSRKWIMMAGVLSVTCSTLIIALLIYMRGGWDWRICLAVASISVVDAFVTPAYFAVTALIVPKELLVRANSCWQFNFAVAGIVSRPLAVLLARLINVWGVIIVDVITYIVVLLSIMLVEVPEPEKCPKNAGSKMRQLKDLAAGWDYIKLRRGLLRLLGYMTVFRFVVYMTNTLFSPMVLSMGASNKTLAIILSVGGIGSAFGSGAVAVWGGPKRRILGVLGGGLLLGCGVMIATLFPNDTWMALGFLLFSLGGPIGGSCSQAVWQSKTEPSFQGRVTSLERMLTQSTLPIACLMGSSLADKVFEPLLAAGGPLAGTIGKVVGTGPGHGIGLLLGLVGLSVVLATIIGYFSPRLRRLEDEVADSAGLPSISPGGVSEEVPAVLQQNAVVGNE